MVRGILSLVPSVAYLHYKVQTVIFTFECPLERKKMQNSSASLRFVNNRGYTSKVFSNFRYEIV